MSSGYPHANDRLYFPEFAPGPDLTKKKSKSSGSKCQCPSFLDTDIPDCTCQESRFSPLLHIRWKRLVLDEGHVSASISSTLLHFAKSLSVEHRWIVTGTPTTNLLGLAFGTSSTEAASDGLADSAPLDDSEDELEDSGDRVRLWTNYDREDLRKLGSMFANFLGVQQFAANPKLFTTHVTDALLNPSGPLTGAIPLLTQLMSFIMIRHRQGSFAQTMTSR